LGTGKLVPTLSIALLVLASLGLAKPAGAAQFTLSGTWNCLFNCPDSGSAGLIKGNFTLDDVTGKATDWLVTTPVTAYQSAQTGTSAITDFSLSFLQQEAEQSHWLTLFGDFLDPSVKDVTIWGNENAETALPNGDYIYGSYWEGEARVVRQSTVPIIDPPKRVPEPSSLTGISLVLLGGGWLVRKTKRTLSACL